MSVPARIAKLATRSVRYLESPGAERGRRVAILLHAFPLSGDQWLPQLHRVQAGWRFIAPDLRGFRGAGPPASHPTNVDPVTIDDYADDVTALMDHLDVERAAIAGLSMGGYIAFGLLRRAPQRVSALVLANTRASADTPDARTGRDHMRDLVVREGVLAVAREMLPKLLGATTEREQPDLVDAVRQMIAINTAEAVVAAIGALRSRPDSTPLLQSIAVPTLVITADEDVIVPPAEAEAMAHAIPGAACVRLLRVGHLSNIEDARRFSDTLNGFLATRVR